MYVTGWSIGTGTADDYATIKYNSSGIEQWVSRYNGPGNNTDIAYSLALDGSGNVYVTGYSKGNGTLEDFATIKYNSSGAEQWVSRYNGPAGGLDVARSLAVDDSANVFVTGYATGATGYGYATIKYNSTGAEQWVRKYNGPGNVFDWAQSVALDGFGNVYVTGGSAGVAFDRDYATIKYNSSGDSLWVQRYNGPQGNSDEASSVTVDVSGNVYVTGYSIVNGNNTDYITVKYSQSVGIHQISNEVPGHFQLKQNYPNPFNPVTKLGFGISDLGFVSLKIYNILGNEIETLVSEKLPAGSYSVEWDASKYTSGTYFYKMETENFVETKKMILTK
ncbi:MAG: SBBP repeat-containing protein [Ignavibacteria bacterium]|nr:SBBP repeat-containing protein [Ignavibacteria bacterium]